VNVAHIFAQKFKKLKKKLNFAQKRGVRVAISSKVGVEFSQKYFYIKLEPFKMKYDIWKTVKLAVCWLVLSCS